MMKQAEKISIINQVLEKYFETHKQTIAAKDMMPEFIKAGIFSEDRKNELPIRKLLRELDENSSLHTYVAFRKCSGCSKNIVDLDMDRQNFLAAPKPKTKYCDDCKRKRKREVSKDYEHSIRILYDELKNNVNICNPKLANEIRNLKPKDKETKSNLQRLYDEYQKEKEKNNL